MAEAELTLKFSQMNGLGGWHFAEPLTKGLHVSHQLAEGLGGKTTKSRYRFGEVGSEKEDLQAVESFRQSEVPTLSNTFLGTPTQPYSKIVMKKCIFHACAS